MWLSFSEVFCTCMSGGRRGVYLIHFLKSDACLFICNRPEFNGTAIVAVMRGWEIQFFSKKLEIKAELQRQNR